MGNENECRTCESFDNDLVGMDTKVYHTPIEFFLSKNTLLFCENHQFFLISFENGSVFIEILFVFFIIETEKEV